MAMALQLSLPLVGATPEPRRLWLISAAPQHLDALRRLLALDAPEALIDSVTGASPVTPWDAILLRRAPGLYEGYGTAAGLVAASEVSGNDLTSEILAARVGGLGAGAEFLAACHGRPPAGGAHGGARNSLEVLFDSLGGLRRPTLERRLDICARALGHLDGNQSWLRALLTAQAVRLAHASGGPIPPPDVRGSEARPLRGRIGLRRMAPSLSAVERPSLQLSLFPPAAARARLPNVPGLGAFRAWGATLPLSPAPPEIDFVRFVGDAPLLSIDEARLGEALGPLQAREVTAAVRLDEPPDISPLLRVSVDWELRLRLGSFFPSAASGPTVDLWVESSAGGAVAVAKRVALGQELAVPSAALQRKGCIRGVVAFRTAAGHVARQRFAFAV